MDELNRLMGNTSLHGAGREPEELLFQPRAENGIPDTVLDNIPRYLFRVASPNSAGVTNEQWAKSESAFANNRSSTEDIFHNLDDEKGVDVAISLNAHLRWWPMNGSEDNFVSWTSSLLFAIQYIYYRYLHPNYDWSLANVNLYIIDTTKFRRGTFMRDLDLIDIFCEYNENPGNFKNLRNLRNMRNGPIYYFGEYISQGALKIENKCQVIPAKIIFENNRLYRLQPRLAKATSTEEKKPGLANAVHGLRCEIWSQVILRKLGTKKMIHRLQSLKEIIGHVENEWKYPVAIYFAALSGPVSTKGQTEDTDNLVLDLFYDLQGGKDCKFLNFKVVTTDVTPELKQVQELTRKVYIYSMIKAIQHYTEVIESITVNLHNTTSLDDDRMILFPDGSDKTVEETGKYVLSTLDSVRDLCESHLQSFRTFGQW